MATLHVRIPDEMKHDLDKIVKLLPYQITVSTYIRSLIRDEIQVYRIEGHLDEGTYNVRANDR